MRVAFVFSLVLLALAGVAAGAQLRGSSPYGGMQQPSMQQQAAQAQQQAGGELVSFLQQHQRAFAAQSAGGAPQAMQQAAPSMAAQAAGAAAAPEGAGDASGGDVLAALEHAPSSLVQTESAVSDGAGAAVAAPGAEGSGQPFGACKTCVFVLERIKKGSNMLLPAICSELYHKYPDAYALCHQVLNALSVNGNNVRYWLFEGCFKYEVYMAKEWIKPCPSHVMCSVLKDLSAAPFCPALPMEQPFIDA